MIALNRLRQTGRTFSSRSVAMALSATAKAVLAPSTKVLSRTILSSWVAAAALIVSCWAASRQAVWRRRAVSTAVVAATKDGGSTLASSSASV
ncbi:hypothetical protein D3C87_1982350 [compost metagenome]